MIPQLLDDLKWVISREIPKFKIRYKNESRLHRFIGALLFFNSAYMRSYTTTLFPVVYFPSKEWEERNSDRAFAILAHEFVHLYDARKHPFLFSIKYLFPQILAPVSFLSVLAIWFSPLWLLTLGSLTFLLPLPSPFRAQYELRGYTMTIAVEYWLRGYLPTFYKDNGIFTNPYIKQFTGSSYYYMWPFETYMTEKFSESVYKVTSGRIQADRPYGLVYNLLTEVL